MPDWKNLACLVLRLTLVPLIVREVLQRRAVTILLYHDPSPAVMEKHLDVLRRRYNLVSLRSFVDAHARGSLDALPPKSLVITFDDGHRGNHALASVLGELDAPATVFLCSGIVGTGDPFWFQTARDPEGLKRMPDNERLRRLHASGERFDPSPAERAALTKGEIEELKSIVDFQSHTISHPILPNCDDDKARHEVEGSKHELETSYELPIFALSYPNGDYSAREIRLAKAAGYECALSVDFGFNSTRTDLYRLRRLGIDDDRDGPSTVIVKACGLWEFVRRLFVKPRYGYRAQPR